MGRGLHGGTVAILGAVVLQTVGCGCAGGRGAERVGVVVTARGAPVLLDVAGDVDFVALEPGATLAGLQTLRELHPGDRVTFTWSRELSGVKLADRLAVDPVIRYEPEYVISGASLLSGLDGAERPVVVDARPLERYEAGHLVGAVSVRWDASDGEIARALPASPAAPLVLYGEHGRDDRPGHLLRRLLAGGRTSVTVLDGGYRGWTEADLRVELTPRQVARLVELGEPWLFVDTRPAADYAAATIPGAVSIPMDEFDWQDFDERTPLPPIIFFGAAADDLGPVALAERVRSLRSATANRTDIRIAVLAGGFAAWEREGSPPERGAPRRAGVPFRARFAHEVSPEEFDAIWRSRGGDRFAVLDVRATGATVEEWVHRIPLEALPARLGELPRDRDFVVICTIGERSRIAAELLLRNGIRARFLRSRTGH